ncbi:MAG: hypothetical protein ACLGGX_11770 [Bdellovibrionia bacterium]
MKKGILVAMLIMSSVAFAQEEATAEGKTVAGDLRERNHEISWASGFNYSYNEDANELEDTRINVDVSYLRNWGRFGLGLGVKYTEVTREDESAVLEESKSTRYLLTGRVNFIEDKVGNDVIPFLSASIGSGSVDNGGTSVDQSITKLALGLKWYPLREIFALHGELYPLFKEDTDGSVVDNYGLSLGMSLNF